MSVECGAKHTFSIAKEIIGERKTNVYAWGDNRKGQTGAASDAHIIHNPHKISLNVDENMVVIDAVSAGKEHSLFLDKR